MQDIGRMSASEKAEIIPNMPNGTNYTVYDERDNQTYTIMRFGNEKLWMTRNLAIGCNGTGTTYGSGRSTKSLTSADSNVSTTWSTGSAGNLTSDTTASYTAPYMQCDATYGAWYNYMAASAGTISGENNTTEATASICPKGWRLPTGAEVSFIGNWKSTFSPVAGGFYNGGVLSETSTSQWWSSSADYVANRRSVAYYNGTDLIAQAKPRRNGAYVRCVLDRYDDYTSFERLQVNRITMQEIGNLSASQKSTLLSQMTVGTAYQAKDTRDAQTYTITKLSDGKMWMTRNLAIGCNGSGATYGSGRAAKTLSTADSNVTNITNSGTGWVTSSAGALTSGNSFTEARMQCNSTYGAYYNYNAATADTITGESNTTNATYDICPKGWRLPTSSEFSGISNQKANFNPVAGGNYSDGSITNTTNGYWWSSTYVSGTEDIRRYALLWENGGSTLIDSTPKRKNGFFVRCIAK